MGRDRLARLIARLAYEGRYDFARYDPRDPGETHRLLMALQCLRDAERWDVAANDWRQWMVLASRPTTEPSVAAAQQRGLARARGVAASLRWPYPPPPPPELSQEEEEERYYREHGRPGEARYEDMITETLELMLQHRQLSAGQEH